VVQNMYLGREAHDVIQRLNEPAMEQKTIETLRGLAVTTLRSVRQRVASLSGGQRQSVAVARAVSGCIEYEGSNPIALRPGPPKACSSCWMTSLEPFAAHTWRQLSPWPR